jgi:DNA-directed RNA polymerase beta subunit
VLVQVNGQCCEDNPDALTHHELLLPGHLLLKFFKEKLEDCLQVLQEALSKRLEGHPDTDLKVSMIRPAFVLSGASPLGGVMIVR